MVFAALNRNGSVTVYSSMDTIELNPKTIMRILQSTTKSKCHIGHGIYMRVQFQTGGETAYTFHQYDREMNLVCNIHMNQEEWRNMIEVAVDLTPPSVNGEICNLCENYVPADYHIACPKKIELVERLVCTKFGEELKNILIDLTIDNYKNMFGDKPRTSERLARAYGAINQYEVLSCINTDNIEHFRNIKACMLDYILNEIKCM